MASRRLGRTDVAVSTVGLGGFELGPDPGDEPDVERAVNVIGAAWEAGIDWIDTSENYLDTANEALIGAALARLGADVLVATKVAPAAALTGGASGFRHDQVHAACRASLHRLGRDRIDIYFLHWPDDTGVPLEETWGAMGELVAEGLVRTIGLSNYSLDDVLACHRQVPVDVVQVGLSLIDHLDGRADIARCGQAGIGVVVYEPLASGILTGKSPDDVLALWSGPWLESGMYRRLLAPSRAPRSFAVADALHHVAARLGATTAQVAIAWVLAQPGVTAAIAGSRDGRHVDENAAAARLDLTPVLAELEELIPLGPAYAGA
jgi:aryl-alcohol dehydrogenase-like predicted oxidoreductase